MLSYQVAEELQTLLSLYDDGEPLMRLLKVASSKYEAIDKVIKNIEINSSDSENARKNLENHLIVLRKEQNSISPRTVYGSIENMKSGFEASRLLFSTDQQSSLVGELDEFTFSYENYIQNYDRDSAISLITAARNLSRSLVWFRNGALTFSNVNNISAYEYENGQSLSIVLSSEMDMLQFIDKLQSISNIYVEICHLLDVSTAEYPIRIIKIESGSLLASIFGHTEVITLLTKYVDLAATYIYGNYTNNGKLDSIPKKVETIDSVLKLRDSLIESGVSIEGMDENISKASVKVARDLNTIISGEAEIKLNDRVISIGDEVQKKMIESNEMLTLSHDEANIPETDKPQKLVHNPKLPNNSDS